MKEVYIVDAVRTAVGKFGGSLATVRPDDLAAHVIKDLINRNKNFDFNLVEDVILGAANQAGEDNRDVARMALLLAGMNIKTGGVTVNRLCASGLQAIADGWKNIATGNADAIISGGTENMTRAPFVMAKSSEAWSRTNEIYDTTIGWRFTNKKLAELYHPYSMGETAENVARQWKITREEQDEFAFNSQKKYTAAHILKKFSDEISPIHIPQKKGEAIIFENDEHPRESNMEILASLKPAFSKDGTVTAGNSSGINDGAAALLLVNENMLKQFHLKPIARIVSSAVAGVDPSIMGIGPVSASQKAMQRAGLNINDIGLIELNEAFASQSIACMRELNINPEIVNVNGGSIAIGHPLGCSGARISTTLLHEMKRTENIKYGLATMCIGVGQGLAVVYEKC